MTKDTMTDAVEQAVPSDGDGEGSMAGAWRGDTGILSVPSRQALLALIKGPYLSGRQKPTLWSALLADESVIRSRLHELFLDLVVDGVAEVAFVRNAEVGEADAPRTVRSESLSFLDTAMLLVLRELLLSREGDGRVIVGQDEVYERLRVYRPDDHDDKLFTSRLNSSWSTMKNRLRILHSAGSVGEDRVEISPVLRLIVSAEQVHQIEQEYRRIAEGSGLLVPGPRTDEVGGEEGNA